MQPCPTCGGMGIDANGYCTQCQTYRGLPQTPASGAPYHDAPYSGAPYGQSPPGAAPYGGYPTSGPGYGQQPTSGPAYGQPTSGSAYGQPTSGPGYAQPAAYPQPTSGGAPMAYPAATYGGAYGAPTAPPKKRSGFMVPLLALSGVLVLLVVAIVVVVLVKNSGDSGGTDNNPPVADGSSSAAASLVDKCVVGTWEMTAYTEQVPVDGVGNVPFKLDGKGATLTFSKDGKGVQDFGDGTNFVGAVSASGTSVDVNLKITGALKYDFRTNDGVMSYSHLTSDAKYTISSAVTTPTAEDTLPGSSDPSKYNCDGSKMTMSTSSYSSELHKTSDDVN
jgi:hypothetical protein